MAHSPECKAIQDRRGFILNLNEATKFHRWKPIVLAGIEGTEQELNEVWSVLEGIKNEYSDNGDQMTEACDCEQG